MLDAFIVARNPEADSSLLYLVFVPMEGGMWLKARETWPRSSRVYCHPAGDVDAAALDVLERIAVLSCQRRGPVVDLVLDRVANRRAQFVFTHARGRPMIFWQTAKAAANARPGLRVPQRPGRALDRIAIDTRERYGYTFKGRDIELERVALRVGDYAAFLDGTVVAVVERKAMDDFSNSLVDGTLGFAMGELAQLGTAAVVVEGTYTQLLRRGFVDGAWLGDLMVRLQVAIRPSRSFLPKRARLANDGRSRFSPPPRPSEPSMHRFCRHSLMIRSHRQSDAPDARQKH